MALGFGEAISILFVIKMVATPFWNEYKKRQVTILKILQRSQMESLRNLSQSLAELVACRKNEGIDSYELYRNLEKLLSLLCLNASHRRVSEQVRAGIHQMANLWKSQDLEKSRANIKWFLLLDPECAEVFEATKVNMGTATITSKLNRRDWGRRWKHRNLPIAKVWRDVGRAFRKSVEGLFNRAKEVHATQRAFAAALCEHDSLLSSYEATDSSKAATKLVEANELRCKLLRLSKLHLSDLSGILEALGPKNEITTHEPLAKLVEWQRGLYPGLLLVDRFGLSIVKGREREIAALFDAVGATDAQRGEIESHINALYGAVHRRWLEDGWIKATRSDSAYESNDCSPFFDFRFRGWRKEKSERRVLFLEHYDLFQLKSPRQLTEEGVLGIVQTMEREEDIVFVRESRLNRELEKIYNRAAENVRHGKSDEAIADFKILLRRASKGADIPVDMLSQIRLHLAYLYADCGENLEEAVGLARRTLEIQDTLFTRLVLGWIYYQQGKVVEAIEELECVKAARRDLVLVFLPLVHLVLGDAYRDAERHQDAEQAWQAGWELANDPEWTEQKGLTPFEVAERVGLRKALSERLG